MDIEKIGEILKKYDNCFFHTDATQSIGKLDTNFENVDLITFSPHKFYGINGIGVLIKKDNVKLEPLILGGKSTTIYRSGTPALPLILSIKVATMLNLINKPPKPNAKIINAAEPNMLSIPPRDKSVSILWSPVSAT